MKPFSDVACDKRTSEEPVQEAAELTEVRKHAKRNCPTCGGAGYYRLRYATMAPVVRFFNMSSGGKLVTRSASVKRRRPLTRAEPIAEVETCGCAMRRAQKAAAKEQAVATALKASAAQAAP